jgi:hypothetical protein
MKYQFAAMIGRAKTITTIVKPSDMKLAIIFFPILKSVES